MQSDYVSRHSLHKVGVGGLCLNEDQVLFVKHTYGVSEGKWTLPGGYVELGETLSEAIEREVFEETSIQTRASDIIAVRHMNNEKTSKGLISDLYVVFNLEFLSGEPSVDNFEISESKFLPLDKLDKFTISDLSKHIVNEKVRKSGFHLLTYQPNQYIKNELNITTYQLYG
ncbi:MAG: NUDIX domain-containing protein [Candidatus Heimdallarchaeota archaeon]|nr:NUDIX domain-containing protein [Candidatus Heimdallarchaeota archaeon]MCK4954278.1 NUDIX domain-containing protein [Candidatus Heimdallarchaeota archaeon]